MINVGEELVGAYLKFFYNCDFVNYNTNIKIQKQKGEIDVIGINTKDKKIYLCEVAIHLKGLQYASNPQQNAQKIYDKFIRAKKYVDLNYSGYNYYFQLWSPLVHKAKIDAIKKCMKDLNSKCINLELVINDKFIEAIEKIKKYVQSISAALSTPSLRTLQIIMFCEKNINKK